MMRFIRILPILATIGFIVLIVSCENDNSTNPQDQIPTIPPQSTMIIDFSEFPDTTTGDELQNVSFSRTNWEWAAWNVSYWNVMLFQTLAIPVAAFVESFNHQPVQQSDGSWLWQYSISVGGATFTAKLYGKTVNEGIEWRMLLTQEGLFDDFEWFTGFSNLPATEGTWTLNHEPNQATALLDIEWYRNTTEGTASVKYIRVAPGLEENGSYIFYGKTNEIPHNRFYQIFGAAENRLIDTKWNYESLFGRVKDSMYFRDEYWHCWDDKLNDTSCPE